MTEEKENLCSARRACLGIIGWNERLRNKLQTDCEENLNSQNEKEIDM